MSSGVLAYDKVAVEQVFLFTFWTRHRTTAHCVGDEVEGVAVDEAVLESGVVEEVEDVRVDATHNTQRRHLREPMLGSGHAPKIMIEWPKRGRSSPPLPATGHALQTLSLIHI